MRGEDVVRICVCGGGEHFRKILGVPKTAAGHFDLAALPLPTQLRNAAAVGRGSAAGRTEGRKSHQLRLFSPQQSDPCEPFGRAGGAERAAEHFVRRWTMYPAAGSAPAERMGGAYGGRAGDARGSGAADVKNDGRPSLFAFRRRKKKNARQLPRILLADLLTGSSRKPRPSS